MQKCRVEKDDLYVASIPKKLSQFIFPNESFWSFFASLFTKRIFKAGSFHFIV